MFTRILALCMLESLDFCFSRCMELSILVLQGRNPVPGSRNMHQKQAGNRKLRSRSCRVMLLELSITSDGSSVLGMTSDGDGCGPWLPHSEGDG